MFRMGLTTPSGFSCNTHPGSCIDMTRLIAAALLFVASAAPALACDWNKSVSTDTPSTVASQPAAGTTTPPAAPAPANTQPNVYVPS
jgi:hypothetical protein